MILKYNNAVVLLSLHLKKQWRIAKQPAFLFAQKRRCCIVLQVKDRFLTFWSANFNKFLLLLHINKKCLYNGDSCHMIVSKNLIDKPGQRTAFTR